MNGRQCAFVVLVYQLLFTEVVIGGQELPLHDQLLRINSKNFIVQVPQGYLLELLTTSLDSPRMLHFSGNGDLFIGSKSGAIYRLPPPYTSPLTLVTLSKYPHSVATREGEILIARHDGLYRANYRQGQSQINADAVTIILPLPAGSGHNSRTVAIGPDGRVYLSLGIRGNCSDEYLGADYDVNRRRGGLLVLNETNSLFPQWQVFASGLRNPVSFAWRDKTEVMYATNNGPDHLGFDQPPEYFSRLDDGSFHGMPWFQYNGKAMTVDPCISSAAPRPINTVSIPEATFPARSAPMGLTFIPAGAMDDSLSEDAIVALHGSWGTAPDGKFWGDPASRREPKLVLVRFDQGQASGVEDLVTGFQDSEGRRWARPVGAAIGPDGALYFTSDAGINGLFRLSRIYTPRNP